MILVKIFISYIKHGMTEILLLILVRKKMNKNNFISRTISLLKKENSRECSEHFLHCKIPISHKAWDQSIFG